jgi:hypothetical protein
VVLRAAAFTRVAVAVAVGGADAGAVVVVVAAAATEEAEAAAEGERMGVDGAVPCRLCAGLGAGLRITGAAEAEGRAEGSAEVEEAEWEWGERWSRDCREEWAEEVGGAGGREMWGGGDANMC